MSKMEWTNSLAEKVWNDRYRLNGENWKETAQRVASAVDGVLETEYINRIAQKIYERKLVPAGRYFKNAGTQFRHYSNCLALDVDDTTEAWGQLADRTFVALMRGTGVGINFSKVRYYGAPIRGTEDYASGPVSLMGAINGIAETVRSGGVRRSALMFCLNWQHKDVFMFIDAKKEDGKLAMANISVVLDEHFFEALKTPEHTWHYKAVDIYDKVLEGMYTTGEPGFLVNLPPYDKDVLVNPCGEFRTHQSGEVCNLGGVNLAAMEDLFELSETTYLLTLFLIAARETATAPFSGAIFDRVGVGFMGLAEWFMQKGVPYGEHQMTDKALQVWANATVQAANDMYKKGHSLPSALRCIAPNGTVQYMAQTTGGIEPPLSSAYIRRWYMLNTLVATPVIDHISERYNSDDSAMTIPLSDRLAVLAQVQKYTDMAISHTINIDSPRMPRQSERDLIKSYLPKLRGLTVYPNGARGNQPIEPITLAEARALNSGHEVEYAGVPVCASGVCGT